MKRLGVAFFIVLINVLTAGQTPVSRAADKVPIVPERLDDVTVVDAEAVLGLKKEDPGILIADVRKPLEFIEEHVEGAVSIFYDEKSAKDVHFDPGADHFDFDVVAKHPGKSVVFYCNGPECWKSFKACKWSIARKLQKKIYWFREGMPQWRAKKFPTMTGR